MTSTQRRGRVERFLARVPTLPERRPRGTVLCYHSLDPAGGPHVSATARQFEEQLDWLVAHANVVSLADITSAGGTDPKPAIALTFDDGYTDNHAVALPALAARGLPATFFVTSGFIDNVGDTRRRMAAVWADPAPDVEAMSWSQVREIADEGFEIGGHTRTHADLAALPDAIANAEIRDDRERLFERINRPVTSFAYPFGRPGRHLTEHTMRLVAEAGYQRAVTVSFRRVDQRTSPLAIPRIPIRHDRPDLLAAKIAGRLDRLGRLKDGKALTPEIRRAA